MTDVEHPALVVDGEVDRIVRLHRDPPVASDKTAWATVRRHGDRILAEHAVVDCPDCGGRSFWKAGLVGCPNCEESKRLIG